MILSLDRPCFGACRLPQAFAEVGLRTAAVCERNNLLASSSFTERFFPISLRRTRLGWLAPIVAAINAYAPDIVLPGDDRAARLVTAMARGSAGVPEDVVRLLRASLGNIDDAELRFSRRAVRRLARAHGIDVASDQPAGFPADVIEFAEAFGWPVVLKREGSAGGEGVYICGGPADISEAFKQVSAPADLPISPAAFVDLMSVALRSRFRLAGDLTKLSAVEATYLVEVYVTGRPAYCTVLARNGEVLAALSLLPQRTHPGPHGPSSIVTAIAAPALEEAARRLIGALGFTGYCGLDFILEADTGKPYFLEFNPRATQIVHLGALFGVDLCGALSCLLNDRPAPPTGPLSSLAVALVPQDLRRDPHGRDRPADLIDMPANDPKLMRALRSYMPRDVVLPSAPARS
jgi:biotin carboxylase